MGREYLNLGRVIEIVYLYLEVCSTIYNQSTIGNQNLQHLIKFSYQSHCILFVYGCLILSFSLCYIQLFVFILKGCLICAVGIPRLDRLPKFAWPNSKLNAQMAITPSLLFIHSLPDSLPQSACHNREEGIYRLPRRDQIFNPTNYSKTKSSTLHSGSLRIFLGTVS